MTEIEDKLKRWYSKLKLSQALKLTFNIIFLLAVLAIVVTTMAVTGRITQSNYTTYVSQLLRGLSTNIEYITNDVQTMSLYVLSDGDVQNVLETDRSSENYDTYVQTARAEANRLIMERDYVESVSVYSFEGNGFTAGGIPSYISDFLNWKEQDWFEEMIEKEGKYIWVDSSFSSVKGEEDRIIFGRVINRKDTQEGIGILLFMLDNEYLSDMVNRYSEPSIGDFYIVGRSEKVLFGPEEGQILPDDLLVRTDISGKKGIQSSRTGNYYLTDCYIPHMDWNLFCVGKSANVLQSQWINMLIIFAVTVIVIFLAAYIYSKLSRVITRELGVLNKAMERAESNNFKEEIKIRRIYEFIQLGEAYNSLIRRMNVLVNEVMREKLNTKQAQLENLQAQINPHFLYNTLNCINWKAMENGQTEISEMIQSMSRMFRFSLGKGENRVELEKELDNIRDYLHLQKKRFEDKLIYLIDVEESLLKCRVIKFFLQPLVENSILHGVGQKSGTGHVGISANKMEGTLVICVWDNGVGIDKEKIDKLLAGDTYEDNQKRHKHGIYNVNERLKMNYGEESALCFENRKAGGTKVTIRIPMDKVQ